MRGALRFLVPTSERRPLWRVLLLGMLAAAFYFAFIFEVQLRIVNVVADGRELVRKDPKNPSLNDTFYETHKTSIHLHVLGPDEKCQFHFHRGNEEATLIAQGVAHVTTRFGKDGQIEQTETVYPEGTLVQLPRSCGHEWHNVTPGTFHTNLVFSRPEFTFNDFIAKTDPRLLESAAPSMVNLHDRLKAFVATGKSFEDTPLPIFGGAMRALLFRESYTVHAEGSEPVSITMVSGEADIMEPGKAHLIPYDLAMITHGNGARLVAPGGPVAALLLYPERS